MHRSDINLPVSVSELGYQNLLSDAVAGLGYLVMQFCFCSCDFNFS